MKVEKAQFTKVRYVPLREDFLDKFRLHGHESSSATGVPRRISDTTRGARRVIMPNILNELTHELGFKLQKIENLKQKHVQALVHHWEDKGLAPKTIQDKMSALRTMADWVGKRKSVKNVSHYAKHPELLVVKAVPTSAKDWSSQGIDLYEKINAVIEDKFYCGLVLLTMYAFGLRIREAMLLRPHEDLDGHILTIMRGTKGGRLRGISLTREHEVETIALLREHIGVGCNLVAPYTTYTQARAKGQTLSKSLKAFKNRCYACFRKHGIGREFGIVPHGLRHEHANERFKIITGVESPLRGGDPAELTFEQNQSAREIVANRLGHSRASISSAYLGGSPRLPKTRAKKIDTSKFVVKLVRIKNTDEEEEEK